METQWFKLAREDTVNGEWEHVIAPPREPSSGRVEALALLETIADWLRGIVANLDNMRDWRYEYWNELVAYLMASNSASMRL